MEGLLRELSLMAAAMNEAPAPLAPGGGAFGSCAPPRLRVVCSGAASSDIAYYVYHYHRTFGAHGRSWYERAGSDHSDRLSRRELVPNDGRSHPVATDGVVSLNPEETVADLVERITAQESGSTDPQRLGWEFLLRPISQELPAKWKSGPHDTRLSSGDSRFVSDVVTAEQRVVVLRNAEVGILDIGVFVAAADPVLVPDAQGLPVHMASQDAPGADWLQAADFCAAPSADEVVGVAFAVGGAGAMRCPGPRNAERVISDDACAALIALVDGAWEKEWPNDACLHCKLATDRGCRDLNALERSVQGGSCAHDFKLLLTPAALAAAVGGEASAAITALLDSLADGDSATQHHQPDAIAVRRTVGTGRWIGFHTDRAAATVQVLARGSDTACVPCMRACMELACECECERVCVPLCAIVCLCSGVYACAREWLCADICLRACARARRDDQTHIRLKRRIRKSMYISKRSADSGAVKHRQGGQRWAAGVSAGQRGGTASVAAGGLGARTPWRCRARRHAAHCRPALRAVRAKSTQQ
jgi:hypothetical protein